MPHATETELATGTASFEHLTGRARGTTTWLSGGDLKVCLSPAFQLQIATDEGPIAGSTQIAHLAKHADTYEIEVIEGEHVWINGRRREQKLLQHGDMIEFGENGPLSRYNLYHEADVLHRSVADVIGDTVGYLRVSRKSLPLRLFYAACQITRRLTHQTTLLFRLSVVLSLAVLAALAYKQYQVNQLLQVQLDRGASQLDGFARSLAQTQENALTPGDLEALRQELNPSVEAHERRLAELERRWTAGRQIIANSSASVIFLQASFGFQEASGTRMLRHVVGPDGRPRLTPFGTPMLSVDGKGPVAARQLTGTGFVLLGTQLVVTNRHVALPWEKGSDIKSLGKAGFKPVMIRFLGYYPGDREPVPLKLVRASNTADLALVEAADTPNTATKLGISLALQPPEPGDQVLILGYPTGLRSMLAQAGEVYVRQLQEAKVSGFWDIAAKLAQDKRINPLASKGIVGQVTGEAIVYDAETTHGGSGGPVLNDKGQVVAVNSAILPKFGGSNIGVPAARVVELLQAEGIEINP